MKTDVERWQALPDEEKASVLKDFLSRLDGMDYAEICRTHDRIAETGHGSWAWEHPVLILRLADRKMAHQIMAWMHSTVQTSQGEMHIPFGGYFLEEVTFDKSSLMQYSESEKEILRQAMRILREKGVGEEEAL